MASTIWMILIRREFIFLDELFSVVANVLQNRRLGYGWGGEVRKNQNRHSAKCLFWFVLIFTNFLAVLGSYGPPKMSGKKIL